MVALAVVVASTSPAIAAGDAPASVRQPDGFLARLMREIRSALDDAAADRRPPVPPVPRRVVWKAQRLTAVDLGAPLLTLAAGDLDRDGRAEVVAITERDVIVLAARDRRVLAEVARIAVPPDPPSLRPRDGVGAAVVVPAAADGGPAGRRTPRAADAADAVDEPGGDRRAPGAVELWARASTSARGARYGFNGRDLRELAPWADFPLCAGRSGALAPGRNYFVGSDPAERYYAVRCRDDLVDDAGRAMSAEAVLGVDGTLAIRLAVRCGSRDAGCPAVRGSRDRRELVRRVELTAVGTAFDIADVDHDGRPEVIHAGAGAAGDADAVVVHTLGGAVSKPIFRRGFTGGVAGIVAADVDGDGDLEVIAAVRLPGAKRVDLWLLN